MFCVEYIVEHPKRNDSLEFEGAVVGFRAAVSDQVPIRDMVVAAYGFYGALGAFATRFLLTHPDQLFGS